MQPGRELVGGEGALRVALGVIDPQRRGTTVLHPYLDEGRPLGRVVRIQGRVQKTLHPVHDLLEAWVVHRLVRVLVDGRPSVQQSHAGSEGHAELGLHGAGGPALPLGGGGDEIPCRGENPDPDGVDLARIDTMPAAEL